MVRIGFHASHEQYRPSALLTYVQQAEDAKLCTHPLTPPMIVGAAITPTTAGWGRVGPMR